MRLSFANGEHADVVVDEGAASLGNAEGNTVVLSGRDVAAWHARLTVDERGIVLHVLDPTARTHVNARPVREKALLRCGDMLCLGKVMIALKADRDDLIDSRVPAETAVPPASYPPRVLLRGVSGSHFGKAIAVNRRLTIGRERGCDLLLDETRVAPRHAAIEHVGDAIYLRETGPTEGTAVNGVRVSAAVVHPGDQLTFGHSHFIVEAPGLPSRGDAGATHAITEPFEAVGDEDANPPPPRAQGAIWWLIGAAALIALGLGLLLHRGF